MTPNDHRGRLPGLNLVDAAIVAFVLFLIPIAYGTFLLFRSPSPKVVSVTRVPITLEERRLAGGSRLSAKLKVKGSGFRPMLRASIDSAPALGFVFENPNSADVLVGEAAPGTHDLVIYDGVQEVARAAKAVTIQAVAPMRVRVAGTLFDLDEPTAGALQPTPAPGGAAAGVEIVKLGALAPGRHRLTAASRSADVGVTGRWERPVVMVLQCDLDATSEDCAVGGTLLSATPLPVLRVAGPGSTPLSLAVDELFPIEPPRPATARIRFSGASEMLDLIRVGDRDACLDDRAATVTAVQQRRTENGVATLDVMVRLGADASRDGWRYRGRTVSPGAPFTLTTERYVASGSVVVLTIDSNGAERR